MWVVMNQATQQSFSHILGMVLAVHNSVKAGAFFLNFVVDFLVLTVDFTLRDLSEVSFTFFYSRRRYGFHILRTHI